jgi:hypothetical protein
MITVIATGFDATRKREVVRRDASAAVVTPVRNPRSEPVDYLAELDQQRPYVTEPVSVRSTGSLRDRQPVPVQVGGSSLRTAPDPVPHHPPLDEAEFEVPSYQRRPSYDSPDIEIPTFLRRKAQEEEELV